MTMITFQEYKALQLELKRCKDDMNNARYSLERVSEVLGNRERLIYDLKHQYEKRISELEKQNKYLKYRLSKFEFEDK